MDIVLWKAKVKAGCEPLAKEWLAFLEANKAAAQETLKQEREHLEVYFVSTEDGVMYLYLFVLADDFEYANKVAAASTNPIDTKHFEYMSACIDFDASVRIDPALALGDFSVFE